MDFINQPAACRNVLCLGDERSGFAQPGKLLVSLCGDSHKKIFHIRIVRSADFRSNVARDFENRGLAPPYPKNIETAINFL
jgi:hypothetical protein